MNIVAAAVLFIGFVVVIGIAAAWPVMVLWGAVADDLGFPTIGLGTALQVSLLSTLLFKSTSSSSD